LKRTKLFATPGRKQQAVPAKLEAGCDANALLIARQQICDPLAVSHPNAISSI
jgi:hypothetical protein